MMTSTIIIKKNENDGTRLKELNSTTVEIKFEILDGTRPSSGEDDIGSSLWLLRLHDVNCCDCNCGSFFMKWQLKENNYYSTIIRRVAVPRGSTWVKLGNILLHFINHYNLRSRSASHASHQKYSKKFLRSLDSHFNYTDQSDANVDKTTPITKL